MLPLNVHNVASVLRTTANLPRLADLLGIPDDKCTNPLTAAEWWVSNGPDRRWRRIIYRLDVVGDTAIADELMPYSEPPSGV